MPQDGSSTHSPLGPPYQINKRVSDCRALCCEPPSCFPSMDEEASRLSAHGVSAKTTPGSKGAPLASRREKSSLLV